MENTKLVRTEKFHIELTAYGQHFTNNTHFYREFYYESFNTYYMYIETTNIFCKFLKILLPWL